MTERTSHLVGFWIGAAISNTSHSNKAGSTTVKEHGSQVKNKGRRQCCHNRYKKFLYRPTRAVYLFSGHAWYNISVHVTTLSQLKLYIASDCKALNRVSESTLTVALVLYVSTVVI